MKINITYMIPSVEGVYAVSKKKKLDAKSDEKKDNSNKKNNGAYLPDMLRLLLLCFYFAFVTAASLV